MELELDAVKIGKVIRTGRIACGETELSMSVKLGFKSHSSYAKIEQGKFTYINIQIL